MSCGVRHSLYRYLHSINDDDGNLVLLDRWRGLPSVNFREQFQQSKNLFRFHVCKHDTRSVNESDNSVADDLWPEPDERAFFSS
jgi:hypothetical protein